MARLQLTNSYALRARVQPVLFVALPASLAAIVWVPEAETLWSAISAVVLASGVPALLAQFGRDRGKRMQVSLWKTWGGPPTTRFLRHRDAKNRDVLARYHVFLEANVPNIRIPTPKEEEQNIDAADIVYESCVSFLLAKTQNNDLFPVVAEENRNYGFRRNLWGLKPLGITIAVLGLLATIAQVFLAYQSGTIPPLPVSASLANLLILIAWISIITPNWIRVPAEAYAGALLSACDQL